MRVVVEPYTSALNVTPDDDVVIAQTRGIMASAAGDLVVVMADGTEVTFVSVVAGHIYPIAVIKVKKATDATGIVALY